MNNHFEVEYLCCEDAELYGQLFGGWFHSMVQLSPGRFGYSGRSLKLPGVQIYLDAHSRSIRWSECSHIPVTAVFIPVQSEGTVRWQGQELDADSAVIQSHGYEHNFTTGPRSTFIYIDIDQTLISKLGWSLPVNSKISLSQKHRKKLIGFCCQLATHSELPPQMDVGAHARDALLNHLFDAVFAPDSELHKVEPASGLSDFGILLSTERILRENDAKEPMSVSDMALKLSVTERSFYRAFERQLGMGPSRYVEIIRLKAIRQFLSTKKAKHQNIADTALMFGFSNPGRMARKYSELFHEYPKETLLRSKHAVL